MKSQRTLKYLSKTDAISGPKDGFCRIIADSWWVVHPDNGLVFYHFSGEQGLGSPQCNRDKTITETDLGTFYPDCSVEFLERAIVPIHLRDYTQ
jgi:hypothetical protein